MVFSDWISYNTNEAYGLQNLTAYKVLLKLAERDATVCEEVNGYCVEIQPLSSEADEYTVVSPGEESLWVEKKNDLWKRDRVVTVAFLEDCSHSQADVKNIVISCAKSWVEGANIRFDFLDDNTDPKRRDKADIRITFRKGRTYSLVGDKFKSAGEPTMNLAISDKCSEDDIRRKALHEFGHALGFRHEHSSPKSPLEFKEDVINSLGKTKQWVKKNILKRDNIDPHLASDFDRLSIMMYEIPASWHKGGEDIKRPMCLSETDKKMVKDAYPFVTEEGDSEEGPRSASTRSAKASNAKRRNSLDLHKKQVTFLGPCPGDGRKWTNGYVDCAYKECRPDHRQCDSCWRVQKAQKLQKTRKTQKKKE